MDAPERYKIETLAVAWSGLPPYAAYCLRKALDGIVQRNVEVCVLSTSMDVPHVGIEEKLGRPLRYIDANAPITWKSLGLNVPDVYFQSGWSRPALNALGAEVRKKGGRTVILMDNNWSGTLRQRVGGLFFRLFQRARYHGIIVPGKAALPLARYLGFSKKNTFQGLYGANPEIFFSDLPILERPKQLLFVGRLNERKRVLDIVKAVDYLGQKLDGWTIKLIGEGTLRDACIKSDRVTVAPFGDTAMVACEMRQSRALLLPSVKEHWGVVVHEAALCGCGLILSSAVGSAKDLIGNSNGWTHGPGDYLNLAAEIEKFINLEPDQLARVECESLELSKKFGPEVFAESFLSALSHS